MPGVFISYSSQQLSVAKQLEAELGAKGVKAWRDKTHLHAGERWPKKLGDAIAESDALVLLWSSEANQSDFVELEWNIAVAMEKPVMPCLLDDTTLPPTLKPSHRIPGHDSAQAADQILAALQGQPPSSATDQQNKLLDSLNNVRDRDAKPKEILRQIKKPWIERAVIYVTFVAGILAILISVMELPQKIGWKNKDDAQTPKIQKYPFEGRILDIQGRGLGDVKVSLIVPGQEPMTVHTKKTGVFAFNVLTEADKDVTLHVEKSGFKSKRRNITIPDQRFVLKMEPSAKEQIP